MTTAKNQPPSKPATSRTAKAADQAPEGAVGPEAAAAGKPAPAAAEQAEEAGQAGQAGPEEREERRSPGGLSVTIPLDSGLVDVAVKAVTLPVTTARKVVQNRNGLPAYLAVGGLAVVGAVEWPVAAATGLGLAAMRRWGPLKPAQNGTSEAGSGSE